MVEIFCRFGSAFTKFSHLQPSSFGQQTKRSVHLRSTI